MSKRIQRPSQSLTQLDRDTAALLEGRHVLIDCSCKRCVNVNAENESMSGDRRRSPRIEPWLLVTSAIRCSFLNPHHGKLAGLTWAWIILTISHAHLSQMLNIKAVPSRAPHPDLGCRGSGRRRKTERRRPAHFVLCPVHKSQPVSAAG